MTKGKYAARADSRLRILESEKVRELAAEITALKQKLATSEQQLKQLHTEVDSKAMRAAAALATKEKAHLRNEIGSLKHQAKEDRLRNAVLIWELLYRNTFDKPAPRPLQRDEDDDNESYRFWLKVNWQIASLCFTDYDEIWDFLYLAEGNGRWQVAGDSSMGLTRREATRGLHSGRIKAFMLARVREMRAHYDQVWAAAQGEGGTVPILDFKYTGTNMKHPDDLRDDIVGKLKSKQANANV